MWGADKYKRWRHGHGFGVHSPHAYGLVREVLRLDSSYGYYAYDSLGAMRTHAPSMMSAGELRLLIRLLAYCHPGAVYLPGEQDAAILCLIINTVLPDTRIIASEWAAPDLDTSAMAICTQAHDDAICRVMARAGMVYLAHDALLLRSPLWALWGPGHMYHNPRRALLVHQPGLGRQAFDISF